MSSSEIQPQLLLQYDILSRLYGAAEEEQLTKLLNNFIITYPELFLQIQAVLLLVERQKREGQTVSKNLLRRLSVNISDHVLLEELD